MDFKRLRVGDWLAGAWGLALLVSLGLDWYGAPGANASAWEALSVTDVLLAIAALSGVTLALVTAVCRSPAFPVAAGVVALALTTIAIPVLLQRLINEPGPNALVTIELGAYAGAVCTLALFAAVLAAVRDESSPRQEPVVPTELPAPPARG